MAQLQEATIKAQCKTLRMPMIASQFGKLAEQAIREKKSHIGYLEALLLARCPASTIFPSQRQLFLPISDNYTLCNAELSPYSGAGRSRG